MAYDMSFLDVGTVSWVCSVSDGEGGVCGRKVGPYSNPGHLSAAIRDHNNMRHVGTAPAMYHEQPGDKRIASASRQERSRKGWRF